MTDLTCAQVRDAAAEYALDIIEPGERSALAAHLLRCPACRAEVEALSGVATRLIELVPGTEPPLGFDRRVLARVREITPASRTARLARLRGHRTRLLAAVATVAAAAGLLFGSVGWLMGHSNHASAHQAAAEVDFHQGGRDVGEMYAYGNDPVWLMMMVHGLEGAPRVTCELVATDGRVTRLGIFDLVGGTGSWGAPHPAGLVGIAEARLVAANGHVVATATVHA
jgi:Putative zinc-finger